MTPNEAKGRYRNFVERDFREHQEDMVEFANGTHKKYTVVEAPPGIGKSLVGACLGAMSGKAVYLVHSKSLQLQLAHDFPEIPIMWGRDNYTCLANPELTADMCMHSKMHPCENKINKTCPYHKAKEIALAAPVAVLNYHYFMTEANYVGRFSGRELIIVDEADSLESVLDGFVGITLAEHQLRQFKIHIPKFKNAKAKEAVEGWKDWADRAIMKLDKIYREVSSEVEHLEFINSELQAGQVKLQKRVGGLLMKLKMFVEYVDDSWVYERFEDEDKGRLTVSFSPTWLPKKMADEFFWRHADRFVLMSGTFPFLPVLAREVALEEGQIAYKAYPSIFPAKSRQIENMGVCNISYKTKDVELKKGLDKVEEIMSKPEHLNEKGLIHTVSYAFAREVMRMGDRRLITHQNGQDRQEVLDRFKASREPLVLVSPSFERGISLDDDLCRFIIWLKAPFLSLNDKRVAARLYGSGRMGQLWYRASMLLAVVQGCGRGMRNAEDRCKSYLLDEQIGMAIGESPRMVPGWFREALW
jgi:Rad3-related DNA helicase